MKKCWKIIGICGLAFVLIVSAVLIFSGVEFGHGRKIVVYWNYGESTDLKMILAGGLEAIRRWENAQLPSDSFRKFDDACKDNAMTAEEFARLLTDGKEDFCCPSLPTPGNDAEAQNIGGKNEPQPIIVYSEKLDPFGHNYIVYYRPGTEQYDAHLIVVSRGRDGVEDLIFVNGDYVRPEGGDDGYIVYWFGNATEHETNKSKPYFLDMPIYEDMTDYIIVG